MERALFADVVMDLDVLQKYCRRIGDAASRPGGQVPRFSRLYAGSEFCANKLPGAVRTGTIVELCRDHGLDLTFVLPPCHDTAFSQIQRLLALLEPGTEVVINDWAELQAVIDAGCMPVFGRALNRLIRDPRLDPTGQAQDRIDYYQTSQAHIPAVQTFIKQNGFVRVELDNVRQGLARFPADALPCSLYTPWTLISVSRFCGPDFADRCPGRPCFESRTFVEDIPIVADGTATFWFHAGMPRNLDELPVNRIVHVTGPEGAPWLLDEITHPAWDTVDLARLQAGREVAVGNAPERTVLEAISPEYKSVLQIGCGFGAYLEILDRMDKTITGIDVSRTALDVARRRVPSAKLVHGSMDGEGATDVAPGPYDLVIDLNVVNGADGRVRAAVARNIADVLVDGSLYLAVVPDTADRKAQQEFEHGFSKAFSFVWQRHVNADRHGPDRTVILLSKGAPDPARNKAVSSRIDEFLDKGFCSNDADFADLTADGSPGHWLDAATRERLIELGFLYIWREHEGEGRTFFRLTHASYKFELEFSPVSQNRPHYRTMGEFNVAYRGDVTDLTLLDTAIDLLTVTLSHGSIQFDPRKNPVETYPQG